MFSPLDPGISVVFELGGHCRSCRVYQLSGFRGAADVQVPASPSTIITQDAEHKRAAMYAQNAGGNCDYC